MPDFLKSINMMVVADYAAGAWDEIHPTTLRKSWRKILPFPQVTAKETSPNNIASDDTSLISHVAKTLPTVNEQDVSSWLNNNELHPGFQLMTDKEICSAATSTSQVDPESDDLDDDGYASDTAPCSVSHSSAAHMFDKCLEWLEHQPEATVHNVTVVKELRALASRKCLEVLRQPSITSFFRQQ